MSVACLERDKVTFEEYVGTFEVTLDDLFCESFMLERTSSPNISEFFIRGGFAPRTLQEIEELPREVLDLYTAQTTQFCSWHDMLDQAIDALFLRMGVFAE